ncbi:hypothetical protein BKA67DRAFT_530923 [Truncatella angustata]|uniref:NAD-dependent epimerase/dehydratase domain-containing protein n=1 Tax=Truncatella angustata TaxID=152316 RepID=A0A9P8UZ96_9PEZI|nr:uncharacterized protein BKA67DRAFT_530923 [Truncatella angustata]KAH6660840.1 hypothetical protein BKA67DRAFT_530923 [Truncatella angustata]KAH8196908.1 hypothetical protein TruAng_008933 [Truncatella angustata]
MSHNILITGGSGYLGGDLLARLKTTNLPSYGKLFALVRTDEQAQKVKQHYGAEPLQFDAYDEAAVQRGVIDNDISVVFHLIDALNFTSQVFFIKALGEVKKRTGRDVHFLHVGSLSTGLEDPGQVAFQTDLLQTTGAKLFSSHAGAPTDQPLYDSDTNLYKIQKGQKSHIPLVNVAVQTNNTVIEQSEALGVNSYIFAPCIVYGESAGFGNAISIQTVAIVKAAKAARRVYRTDEGRPTWPVCHINDNTTLYIAILEAILSGSSPDHGRNGYYLAASGSVAWDDLYDAFSATLTKRGVVEDARVELADESAISKMAQGLGYPPELVAFALGGKCTFVAKHGEKVGWKPEYPPEHILEDAEREVDVILANI